MDEVKLSVLLDGYTRKYGKQNGVRLHPNTYKLVGNIALAHSSSLSNLKEAAAINKDKMDESSEFQKDTQLILSILNDAVMPDSRLKSCLRQIAETFAG